MIIARIHNRFKNLTPAEQKIASYVLSHPEDVVSMTVKELAKKCGTAPSAVNRMCASVGTDGFSQLKIQLALNSKTDDDIVLSKPFSKDDSCELIFNKVFNSGISALKNSCRMIDFSVAEKLAKKILSSARVFIFAVGTSSVIAQDAAYRFSQLGVQCYAYTDILQMNVMAKNMTSDDLAFGISHSGSTKAVVDVLRIAKKAGAATAALTSFENSLIAKESDYTICVYADEENYPVEAVSARIAHICVVDALMLSIAAVDYDGYNRHISRRNDVLNNIRY